MKAQFIDLNAAADFMGPGAIEVDRYQTEITDIVRRRGVFGQRVKQVPATGHPSRFFEQTAIVARRRRRKHLLIREISSPRLVHATRVERSVPLKALVSQINYNLFDLEVGGATKPVRLPAGERPGRFGGRVVAHARCCAVERQRHFAEPLRPLSQYFGAIGQIEAGGNTTTIATTASIVDGIKSTVAQTWWRTLRLRCDQRRFMPIRSLLDLIDREMKAEFNVVLSTAEITAGLRVKMLIDASRRSAADSGMGIPLYTGSPGSVLPCSLLHRHRRPDRVSLADRSESSGVQAGLLPMRWLRRWSW